MTREADRALLVAFCEWLRDNYACNTTAVRGIFKGRVEAFLASRAPAPPDEHARCVQCPACGEGFLLPGEDGKRLPPVPCAPPTTEQRYWRVVDECDGSHWALEVVNAAGVWQEPPTYYPITNRDDAVRDGMALALPEWRKP